MKNAIVIGATSGIGRGVARLLAANGYRVGITGRREQLLLELKAENPDGFVVRAFDLTNVNDISQHLDALTQELGGLDLLLINSGTGHRNPTLDFSIEEPAILTNVHGFTAAADWGFNYFEKQGFGHLAVVSSIAGIRGNRYAPAYGASKAYQMSYIASLRHKAENLKLDITLTDIRPGFVDTVMAQGDGIFWVAPVEKAAAQIVSALQKRKKTVYITRRWRIIAFLMPLIPGWIYKRI
jgi:short-subunit dehydrogenase